MKEYDVKITETLEKTVTVQAENRDAAEEQVKTAYYNSEHILDAENFTGVAFGTQAEREIQQEQAPMMDVLLIRPNMYPQHVQIGCELEDLQKAVGGDIQAVYNGISSSSFIGSSCEKFNRKRKKPIWILPSMKEALQTLRKRKLAFMRNTVKVISQETST